MKPIVSMDVVLVMVIAVGAPLLVKVAVPSGWMPPDQLPGVVHAPHDDRRSRTGGGGLV